MGIFSELTGQLRGIYSKLESELGRVGANGQAPAGVAPTSSPPATTTIGNANVASDSSGIAGDATANPALTNGTVPTGVGTSYED